MGSYQLFIISEMQARFLLKTIRNSYLWRGHAHHDSRHGGRGGLS